MKIILTFLILMFVTMPSFARGGYDYSSGGYVDIEQSPIDGYADVYDYNNGSFETKPIDNSEQIDSANQMELYDYSSGQFEYIDMD